jgi:archaeosine synthase beta-subunit
MEKPIGDKARKPLYDGVRSFLGRKDLVLSFYTRKCQFDCSYCTLPNRSSNEDVPAEDINRQIDFVFEKYSSRLRDFRQLSFGNEGSVLDRRRFHTHSMHHLIERSHEIPDLDVLSLETRPEYLHRAPLEDVLSRTHARTVDVTVGFETQDDEIRQGVLRKRISRRVMEDRVALLGALGIRLTSYVMVRPAPGMTEEHGVQEAVATVDYLRALCARHGVDLVVYLTPLYVAEGSYLQRTTNPSDWMPPTIQSVYRVVRAGLQAGVPVYTGLWSEGLAVDETDFTGRHGYDPAIRAALLSVNRGAGLEALEPFSHLAEFPTGTDNPWVSTASSSAMPASAIQAY